MKKHLFLAVVLMTVLGTGMVSYCQNAEVYGTPERAAVYGSPKELQNAVTRLYEGWESGLEGYRIRYEDLGVTLTSNDSNYSVQKDMVFSCSDGFTVGYLRYEAEKREDMNIDEITQMAQFASTLMSGETAGFSEEVKQNLSGQAARFSKETSVYNWFKRINGINYTYGVIMFADPPLNRARLRSQFIMSIAPDEMRRSSFHGSENIAAISIPELMSLEAPVFPYTADGDMEYYRVHGKLQSIETDDSGTLTGKLTDGTNSIFVQVNAARSNTVEEYQNSSVFYIQKLGSQALNMRGSEYIVFQCE